MSDWAFGNLRPFSFGMFLADPPWLYKNYSEKGEEKNASAHYKCMELEDICALPVGHLAMQDAWLVLFGTNPMLREAFTVMDAWGFKFVTSGAWTKRGKDKPGKPGKLAFGPGYVLRCASEPFLIGKVGNPPICNHSIRTVIEAPRRRHSEKPTEAYELCERLAGDVPRISLFDRKSRPGWVTWGDQAEIFDTDAKVSTRQIREQEKLAASGEQREPERPLPLLSLLG